LLPLQEAPVIPDWDGAPELVALRDRLVGPSDAFGGNGRLEADLLSSLADEFTVEMLVEDAIRGREIDADGHADGRRNGTRVHRTLIGVCRDAPYGAAFVMNAK